MPANRWPRRRKKWGVRSVVPLQLKVTPEFHDAVLLYSSLESSHAGYKLGTGVILETLALRHDKQLLRIYQRMVSTSESESQA